MNLRRCETGKVGHWTKAAAKDELRRMIGKARRGGRRYHVYLCALCDRWHVGSVGSADDLTQLRETA